MDTLPDTWDPVDGKPDLSGIWRGIQPANIPTSENQVGPNLAYVAEIPLTTAGAAIFRARSAALGVGRPSESCLPHGIPDAMITSMFRLIRSPGITFILYEEFNHYRQIFTDGRPFPPDPNPA